MHIGVLSTPGHFHTERWTRALLEAGARVTVFSFDSNTMDGVACVRIRPRFSFRGKASYASFLYSGKALREALVRHDVDLLNPINVTPFGVWGARSGFSPMISVAMGADILEYPPSLTDLDIPEQRRWASAHPKKSGKLIALISRKKRDLFRKNVQMALDHSDLITGDNQLLLDKARDWFGIAPHKLLLNRWGVETDLYHPEPTIIASLKARFSLAENQAIILSPRGMKPIYQADLILDAFELMLRAGFGDAKLIMLSAGYPVPPGLAEKARDLARRFPNFHFEPGLLSRPEMAQLWNMTSVFVSAPVYDGLSNALTEGRYAGAIPVVNDVPATREVITHQKNGWIVHPFQPTELADALTSLSSKLDQYRADMAATNREWVEKNALLQHNIRDFLGQCEQLISR